MKSFILNFLRKQTNREAQLKNPKNRDCLNKSCVSNAKTWEPVLKLTHVSLLIVLKFYISLFMDVNRSSHLILIFPFWTKWYNDKMTRNSVTWPLETDLVFLCKGMTVDRLRHFRFHKYLKITIIDSWIRGLRVITVRTQNIPQNRKHRLLRRSLYFQ